MTTIPIPSTSARLAVGIASAQFSLVLADGSYYVYTATVGTWIAQGANPTASAAAGSMFVPANTLLTIAGLVGAKLAVIRASVDGDASLTLLSV